MNLEILNLTILISLLNMLGFLNFRKAKSLFCGIVAYNGTEPANPDKLSLLLYMNSEKRGGDNTGIYCKETGIIKTAQKAEDFLSKNVITATNLFIGHARKASVGSKQEKNGHPFEFSNLIGVHNGTLENHWEMLRKSEKDYKVSDFDVDSQVLYNLLDDDCAEFKEDGEYDFPTLTQFLGAAALVFTDKRYDNRLYAYKTMDRPLFYGLVDNGIYLSSVEEGLKVIGCKETKSLLSNYLYTIEDGKIGTSVHYKQAVKPTYTPTVYKGGAFDYNKKSQNYYDRLYEDDEYYEYNKGTSTNSRVSNFVQKSVEKYRGMADYNNNDLKDRWLMCMSNFLNKPYGKSECICVTKDVWYKVEDYSVSDNCDVIIRDDNGVLVNVNKYLFDASSLSFTGYARAQTNIVDGKKVRLWSEGDIIEIIDGNIKNGTVELFHIDNDRSYPVPVSCIREASIAEIKDWDDAEEVRKASLAAFFATNGEIIHKQDESKDDDKEESPFQDSVNTDALDNSSTDNKQDGVNANNYEVIDEDDDNDALTVSFSTYLKVLSAFSDEIKDIKELVDSTNFDELKERFSYFSSVINNCKDVEYVESNME